MPIQTVILKDHPELLAVVRAVDPSYRKPKAVVRVGETVTLSGTYWSGGTRSTYTAVSLATKQSSGAPQYNPPQFGGPASDPIVTLPEGAVIVETGTFCGKKATAVINVHPANVAKVLPAPQR